MHKRPLTEEEKAGFITHEVIPGYAQLISLDPAEAAKMRWEWGKKYIPTESRMEENLSIDPIGMALEELWDFINFANEAIRQERCSNLMKECRDEVVRLAYRIGAACLRGESVAGRSSSIP